MAIAYLTPYGRNHKVTGVVAVVDQPVKTGPVSKQILISHCIASHRIAVFARELTTAQPRTP